MKVSLNTIKQLINFELPPVAELKKRIDEQLGKVEDIVDLGAKYKDAVIVKVVRASKHPNADKLTVCVVDDNGSVKDVPRDENGYIQVVCGAPNVHDDMYAVWLPPNATVPASFDDNEPFVLSARELRGVLSQGMLAAADELGIGADHNGIIEITQVDMPADNSKLEPGASFAKVFGLDGYVIDIENKMFTHRPDLFGHLGVAREIAGILGEQFTSPEWYTLGKEFDAAEDLQLEVFNDATEKAPRFMAVAIKNITVKPSPLWLQCQLVSMGSKPINNIVDATNYVMLITAQPTHAYDYDKLRGHKIGVRMAGHGEKATLLNDKDYELTPDDIVIADGEGVIGLGGIMGGLGSEVSGATKNIVLEVANFDMYTVRKTSMRHGLFTDAVARFNKGQSPLQNAAILVYLINMVGGNQASKVFDLQSDNLVGTITSPFGRNVSVTAGFINDRLGLRLEADVMSKLLENVEFSVSNGVRSEEPSLNTVPVFGIQPPFWRTDIEQPEDIVEEVGRLYGFDKLLKVLPHRSLKPVAKNQKREVAHLIRQSLSRAGANEVLTYSFVHKNTLERANQDPEQAFRLSNALSPDLQYYRLSLTPSLLDKIHSNVRAGYDEFAIFEIGKGHNKKYHADDDNGLPSEIEFADLVYTSKSSKDGAAYYRVRDIATQLAADLGFTLKFSPIVEEMDFPVTAPFNLTRSAMVTSRQGEFIGLVGEFDQSVLQNFKLPAYTAGMTLDLQGLVKAHAAAGAAYAPLSRFPAVTQDISLKVPTEVTYEDVFWTVWSAIQNATDDSYSIRINPLAIYQNSKDSVNKTLTLRVQVTNYGKTLTDSDIKPLLNAAAQAAGSAFGAERS